MAINPDVTERCMIPTPLMIVSSSYVRCIIIRLRLGRAVIAAAVKP